MEPLADWLSYRSSTSHHETQGSQDALAHFVIPRPILPLLFGQFKLLSCIFCEEREHLPVNGGRGSEQVMQPGFIQQHLLVGRTPERVNLLCLAAGSKGLLLDP